MTKKLDLPPKNLKDLSELKGKEAIDSYIENTFGISPNDVIHVSVISEAGLKPSMIIEYKPIYA